MTSTGTFTGMEREAKPSSRVLAPPGGGSSNIFGDTSAPVKQPPKPQPVPEKQDNILGQPPQKMPEERNIRGAPKQGESTYSNLFGSASPTHINDTSTSKDGNQVGKGTPNSARVKGSIKCQDTFKTVYGDPDVKVVPNTPNSRRQDNSFFNIFTGDQESSKPLKSYKAVKSLSLSDPNPQQRNVASHASVNHTNLDSFCRVFGEFQGDTKPSCIKHFITGPSVFNPITGEPYGPPSVKNQASQEPTAKDQPKEQEVSDDQNGSVEKEKVKEQAQPTPSPVEPREHTSTRVLNPPGGKSTPLW